MKNKANVTKKDTREHLAQLHLACELVKAIKHFFPGLLPMLRKLPDPKNQSYITYSSQALLMTRILSSIFYISSMRKTSGEFNSFNKSFGESGKNLVYCNWYLTNYKYRRRKGYDANLP